MAAGQISSESIFEFLDLQRDIPMSGHIRTFQKCPICQKPFTLIERIGYFCATHKTFPNRFVIDIHLDGRRVRIYSDKQGQVLDSYQRAYNLQSKITWERENHTFDASKYVRQDVKQFYAAALLDRFEAAKLPEIAPSHKIHYRRQIKSARSQFGSRDVRDLRRIDLIDYKAKLEERFGPKTVRNFLSLFGTFLNWCKNDLEILENVPPIPSVEVPDPGTRWLPMGELAKLYEFCPGPHRPIISFLFLHGCRPSEARALKVKDVNIELRLVSISATFSIEAYRNRRKGRKAKAYTIPIHPETFEYIKTACANSLPEAWLFPNPNTEGDHYSQSALKRVWDSIRQAAGISKGLRLYDATRHSVASNLRAQGAQLHDIKDQLGHSDIRTTLRYAHGNPDSLRTNLAKLSLDKVVTVCGPSVGDIRAEKNQAKSNGN